jgi:hypothetical protein
LQELPIEALKGMAWRFGTAHFSPALRNLDADIVVFVFVAQPDCPVLVGFA